MTEHKTADEVRAEIHATAKALQQAQADLEAYQRLQKAQGEVARLTKLGNELTGELIKAIDRDDKAELARIADGIRNLRVIVMTPKPNEPAGVNTPCRVEFERYAYNGRANVWTPTVVDSFANLDPRVLRYLLEVKPDALPSLVTNFAPGEPRVAMERYLNAKKRGFTGGRGQ